MTSEIENITHWYTYLFESRHLPCSPGWPHTHDPPGSGPHQLWTPTWTRAPVCLLAVHSVLKQESWGSRAAETFAYTPFCYFWRRGLLIPTYKYSQALYLNTQGPSNCLRLKGNLIQLILMSVIFWSVLHHLEMAQNLIFSLPLI